MKKHLTVYPIASGDMLNIFAEHLFTQIRIMDMEGNLIIDTKHSPANTVQVNIKSLSNATYIIEVAYNNNKTGRSVFVK